MVCRRTYSTPLLPLQSVHSLGVRFVPAGVPTLCGGRRLLR
ncbi:hypothetical protein CBM2600_B10613 [Cupriavidus taiwanensis]|nr:hypothetical protein CBM2600_B10613 [Cupriavidus taiwanensis]